MKSVIFSDKKSLLILSNEITNNIKLSINNIGNFNLTSKYYTFLNKKNVNKLKEKPFLVTLSTFGKKFILFITKYNNKNYCIFINKKNDKMTVTQLKFSDDIFLGTLFDGELIKNEKGKWIYLINDIVYYKGKNIITKSFLDRQYLLEDILKNEHQYSLIDDTLYISKKKYFDYNNIKSLVNDYATHLNYKCSGLYFKCINNFSDNYLFIFPECRSDSKILSNSIDNKKNNDDDNDNELFIDAEIIKDIYNEKKNLKPSLKPSLKLEKITCSFLIFSTDLPDIYELHLKNSNNNIEKYSYASVPDIETSNFLKDIFLKKEIKEIYVECNYHKLFKKWVPYKIVEHCDNINTVNEIQIILDSL